MARGTGLPAPDSDATVQPAGLTPQIDAGLASNAAAWGQIAKAGEQVRQLGLDAMEHEKVRAQTGHLAGQEVEIGRKRIELGDKYALDPAGFDREWTAYSDGKLSEAEPWAIPHLKNRLGQEGNSTYGALLNQKRTRDRAADGDRVKALAEQASNDFIGAARAGELSLPRGQAAAAKYRGVLDTAVSQQFMTPEEADLQANEIGSRAGAESIIKTIGDSYRENRARGLEAGDIALKEAESLLLRTDAKGLSGLNEEQRYGYFHKATSEIRALESERKQDLNIAKQGKTQIEFGLTNGIRPPQDAVDDVVQQLEAAGGHAEAARLRASVTRYERLSAFGRMPLEEQVAQYDGVAGAMGADVPSEMRGIIAEASKTTGVSSSYLFSTARRESNFNPNAKAPTSSAEGLYQFTDSTWRYMLGRFGDKYGLSATTPKTDARASALLAGELAKANGAALLKAGVPASDANLYIAHFAGSDGAVKLLSADKSANAAELLPAAAKANRSIFYDGDRARSVSEVVGRLSGKVVSGAGSAGVDVQLITGQRKELSREADERWGKIKAGLDEGLAPSPAEIKTLIHAATLAGDHDLLEDIGERLDRSEAARVAGQAPLTAQQGAVAELQSQNLTAGQAAWLKELEKTVAATKLKLQEDPIALAAQRFPERFAVPAPFNLSNADAALGGLATRAHTAAFVAANYGQSDIPVLGKADRTQIADAIAAPTPERKQAGGNGAILSADKPADVTANAFAVLTHTPDEFFTATISSPEIKAAVAGAARSTDPQKYLAAMQGLDRLWARAPQEVQHIFGDDVIRSLQDWQSKLRYYAPEQLADQLRERDDPQARERRKAAQNEGHKIAAQKTIAELVSDLDPGWLTIGPNEPVDARARDVALGDYSALFAERYAETLDADVAQRQTIEKMRTKWGRSEVNGGQLTLYPPESVYPTVSGSHDWMKAQIVGDLIARLGYVPEDYSLTADRETQDDIRARRAPSYLISIKKQGVWGVLRGSGHAPARIAWEAKGAIDPVKDKYAAQRDRVFRAPAINLGSMIR